MVLESHVICNSLHCPLRYGNSIILILQMNSKDTEKLNDIAKITHILFERSFYLKGILKDLSSVASALETKDPTYSSDLGTLCNLVVSREK